MTKLQNSWLLVNTIQIPLHEHERLDIFAFKWKTYQINRLVKISWKMAIFYFTCPVFYLSCTMRSAPRCVRQICWSRRNRTHSSRCIFRILFLVILITVTGADVGREVKIGKKLESKKSCWRAKRVGEKKSNNNTIKGDDNSNWTTTSPPRQQEKEKATTEKTVLAAK